MNPIPLSEPLMFINPKEESEPNKSTNPELPSEPRKEKDSAFLSQEDVAILTGRKIKSRQVEQLRNMGIAFYVNASGRPVVPRSSIEGTRHEQINRPWEPNITI